MQKREFAHSPSVCSAASSLPEGAWLVYQFCAYVGRGFTPADLAIFSFLQNEFLCSFMFPSIKVFEGCGGLWGKAPRDISKSPLHLSKSKQRSLSRRKGFFRYVCREWGIKKGRKYILRKRENNLIYIPFHKSFWKVVWRKTFCRKSFPPYSFLTFFPK